ncbi:MAG: tetratricopeptide repeat protein [Candidatus Omnitrophota bacterium]
MKKILGFFIFFLFICSLFFKCSYSQHEFDVLRDRPRWEDLVSRGKVYIDTGFYDRAINYYQKLTLLFSDVPVVQYCLGYAYYKNEDYEDARKIFERTVKIEPDFAEAYFYLAVIAYRNGEKAKSLEHLNRVTAIDRTFQSAYFNRGVTYLDLKEYLSAIRDFAFALYLDPASKKSFEGLARAYAEMEGRSLEHTWPYNQDNDVFTQRFDFEKEPKFNGNVKITAIGSEDSEIIEPAIDGIYEVDLQGGKYTKIDINFSEPIDLRKKRIKFLMKGITSGEKIILKIKDDFTCVTPQLSLGEILKDWKIFSIDPQKEAYMHIDISKIKRLSLEFHNGRDKSIGRKFFLKELGLY